jgi:hypothetical protein
MSEIVIPEAATLQALTEKAVASREERPQVAQELFVPAVQTAQQVTSQLVAYDLGDETFKVKDKSASENSKEKTRLYTIQILKWKTGKLGSRTKHSAPVLVRECEHRYPLWDPRNPSRVWDLNEPPLLNGLGLDTNWFCDACLPDAAILAQWAKDAIPLLQSVVDREAARASHLSIGLAKADAALHILAV